MKRATPLLAAWSASVCVAVGVSTAGAATLVCPAKVRLEAGRVAAEDLPADARTTVASTPIHLSGISAYDGPPEQGAALMPASSGRNGDRSTWRFGGPAPDGRWLSCDYADGLVHVARRVDEGVTACEGVATKSGSPRTLRAEFTCR